MPKRLARPLLLLLTLCTTGCGTLGNTIGLRYNQSEHLRVYGGVQLDLEYAKESLAEAQEAKTADKRTDACASLFLRVADMPLSALGDTLTLPFTIPEGINRALHPEQYPGHLQAPASEPDRSTAP